MKKLLLLVFSAWLLMQPGALAQDAASPASQPQAPAILEIGGNLALVNRQNRVSRTYEPDDLVQPRVATRKASLQERIYLRQEAAQALEAMF